MDFYIFSHTYIHKYLHKFGKLTYLLIYLPSSVPSSKTTYKYNSLIGHAKWWLESCGDSLHTEHKFGMSGSILGGFK